MLLYGFMISTGSGCVLYERMITTGSASLSVLHALCSLSSHFDAAHGVELGLGDVQVAVQTAAFTPLSDDGKVGFSHEAHKQQDVDMTCLPVGKEPHRVTESHTKQQRDTITWRHTE